MSKMPPLIAALIPTARPSSMAHASDLRSVLQEPAQARESRNADFDLERNKALVRRLFDIIYGTSLADIQKIDDLVAVDYIQHNPRALPGA